MFEDIKKVLLVSDMDGTLLNNNKEVSDKNLRMIRKFEEAGGKFTIASGRVVQSTAHYFDILQLKIPCILYNGGMVYDKINEKALFRANLPSEARNIASEILEEFSEIGAEVLTLDEIFVPQMNDVERMHTELARINYTELPLNQINSKIIKILFAMEPKYIETLKQFIEKKGYDTVDFVNSDTHYYEMLPKGVSKGSCLKELVEIMGYHDYTVVAVGDYYNDIQMLKTADFGVAPLNAHDDVKKCADYVLKKSADEDAIAEVIEYIFDKTNIG